MLIKRIYERIRDNNILAGVVASALFTALSSINFPYLKELGEKFFGSDCTSIEVNSVWLYIVLLIQLLETALLVIVLALSQRNHKKIKAEKKTAKIIPDMESTAIHFSCLISDAEPGLRGYRCYTNGWQIGRVLKTILGGQKTFETGEKNSKIEPFWYFRGRLSEAITNYKRLCWRKFLICHEEVVVDKLYVYHDPRKTFHSYIYLECRAEKPTGLYNFTEEDVKAQEAEEGYFYEEFYRARLWKLFPVKLKINEGDDGGTKILGIPVKLSKLSNRVRYLTRYNFIITAKGSVYNKTKYDRVIESMLDSVLRGQLSFEEFNNLMLKFA